MSLLKSAEVNFKGGSSFYSYLIWISSLF